MTTGVADFGGYYTINFAKGCFDAPEAAGGKSCMSNVRCFNRLTQRTVSCWRGGRQPPWKNHQPYCAGCGK